MPATVAIDDIHIPAAELERLYADIERHLAQHAPTTARSGIALPPVEELIRQAGITTGPASRERRTGLFRRRVKAATATVAEHLAAVADLIERHGWTQGTLQRGEARCILGAQLVLVHIGHSSQATAEAGGLLLDLGCGGRRYWEWQDYRYRTRAEVLALVRVTADYARKVGA